MPAFPGDSDETVAGSAPGDEVTRTFTHTPAGSPLGQRLAPGQMFGPYRIHRLLGAGGMGEVYEAEHLQHQRRVALKVLSRARVGPDDRARFLREGQLAASISHPNTVYVFGSDEIAGVQTIAMELVGAGTLRDRITQRGPMPVAEAVDAVLQIIEGLHAAARTGILHRDIKPSNCFVELDGSVKVGDFGLSISTLARHGRALEELGIAEGTPAFASPEQLRGDAIDVRSDIYAVGATLYYLLTGRAPLESDSLKTLLDRVQHEPPASAHALRREVSQPLSAVIARCLAKDPSARPASYEELLSSLEPHGREAPILAPLTTRFVAYLIDGILLTLIMWPLRVTYAAGSLTTQHVSLQRLFVDRTLTLLMVEALATVVYFGALEGWRGASIGKWLCGVRVVGTETSVVEGRRSLVRAFLYALLTLVPFGVGKAVLMADGVAPQSVYYLSHFAALGVLAAALLPLALPLRRTLYELGSGTVTIKKKSAKVETFVSTPDAPPSIGTGTVGPYVLAADDAGLPEGMRLARDPLLQREVWIQCSNNETVDQRRRDLRRNTRLRWLNAGSLPDGRHWDAFEAPGGTSFASAITEPHGQRWPVVRAWVRDLAEEISSAEGDQTLPPLACDRVWIDGRGRARLVEWPAPASSDPRHARAFQETHEAQPFLEVVARYAVHGRPIAVWTEPREGPLPLSAREALARLAAADVEDAAAAREMTARLTTSPSSVTPAQRAGHLIVNAAVLLLVVSSIFTVIWRAGRVDRERRHSQVVQVVAGLKALDSPALPPALQKPFETFVIGELSPPHNHPATLRALDQHLTARQRDILGRLASERRNARESAEAAVAIEPAFAQWVQPLPSHSVLDEIIWNPRLFLALLFSGLKGATPFVLILVGIIAVTAAITRGGAGFGALNLAVVDADGTRPSRARAAGRALLSWLPLAVGMVVFSGASRRAPQHTAPGDGLTILALIAGVVCVGVFLAGAAVAARNPQRGWQDRLAGTWLVPR